MSTYYINADVGNDSTGDGSTGTPWLTLAFAVDQVASLDTIICQDSTATYAWNTNTYDIPNGYTVTIQGEQTDGSGAVFDGAGSSTISADIYGTIIVEKVTWQNAKNFSAGGRGQSFMNVLGGDTTMTFNNCVFKDLTVFTQAGSGGIAGGDNATAYEGNITFNRCLFELLLDHTTLGTPSLFTNDCNVDSTYIVKNCTIYLTDAALNIIVGFVNGTCTFQNNIVYHSGTMGWGGIGVDTANVDYNCFYGDGSAFTNIPAGTGNITSNPLFVDPDNSIFKLQPTSPCIDAGTLV